MIIAYPWLMEIVYKNYRSNLHRLLQKELDREADMNRIEKMAAAEFRKLPRKRKKEINARKRIAVAPAGRVMENKKHKIKTRRWKWDGSVSCFFAQNQSIRLIMKKDSLPS